LVDNNDNKNEKSMYKHETVIPLSNSEYRYIQKVENKKGNYMVTRDGNYKAEITRYFFGAEEDVAAQAIRRFKGESVHRDRCYGN
jgi:hypothetical protein